MKRRKGLIIFFIVICSFAIIVLLSSVIFSVQHVYEYCYNYDSGLVITNEQPLGERVLQSHGIRKGKSIFLLDKQDVIRNVESKVPEIRVVNIEKKFPNRVYINYAKLFDYMQIYSAGKFYILSNDCKVTGVREEAMDPDQIIRLILQGNVGNPRPGERLNSSVPGETEILAKIMNALEMLDLGYSKATQLVEFIDLAKGQETYFLKTVTGAYIRLHGINQIAQKMQMAVSIYTNNVNYRNSGTITVDNKIKGYYSPSNFYDPESA